MTDYDLGKSATQLAKKKKQEEYQKIKQEMAAKKEAERQLQRQQKITSLKKLIKKASDLKTPQTDSEKATD